VEKYQEKYTFQPRVSRFASSTVINAMSGGSGGNNSNSNKNSEAFFERMHKTPKVKRAAFVEEKKPERKLRQDELQAMVERLNGTNLQRYVARKEQRRADMDATFMDRSSICHQFQPRRTRDLARRAREKSASEIFDVLLMSVEHWQRTQKGAETDGEDCGGEQQQQQQQQPGEGEGEGEPNSPPGQRMRRDSAAEQQRLDEEALLFRRNLQQIGQQVHDEIHDSVMEIEKDLFHPLHGTANGEGENKSSYESAAAEVHDPVADFANTSALRIDAPVVTEHTLLDTVNAQPRFLQPLYLAEAIEIIIRDARPAMLSREDFIDRVEVLIASGVGPPINAILIAPQRAPRYKHSKEMEVDQHVRPPTLAASKANTRMAAARMKAHSSVVDPMKYSRDREAKLARLKRFQEQKEMEECTFQPVIKTDQSWNHARRSHDKHYHEVLYKPPKLVSKPAPFSRDTVMRPTTASISHRASEEYKARVQARAEAEREQRISMDTKLDAMEAHVIERPLEFLYVDNPLRASSPSGSSSSSSSSSNGKQKKALSNGGARGDFDEKIAGVTRQHDKEYSVANQHSSSHMPLYRSDPQHAGANAKALGKAEKAMSASRKHVSDDFEQMLAEVEGKIPRDIKAAFQVQGGGEGDNNGSGGNHGATVNSSMQSSTSSGGSGYLARHEARR
jgi:hypothetical protein